MTSIAPKLEPGEVRREYSQGITVGYYDRYTEETCDQYMDIDGVPDGEYIFSLSLNYDIAGERLFEEESYGQNVVMYRVQIAGENASLAAMPARPVLYPQAQPTMSFAS